MPAIRHRRLATLATALVLALLGAPAAPAAAQPSSQDTSWLIAAHQSNLAEIAAGTAAQQQALSASVRDLGAMFVEMHAELDAQLTTAATQLGVALPTSPTPEQQGQLAAVTAQQGDAFDAAWVAQQIAAHQQSLLAIQTQLQSGTDPSVVQLAQAAAPVVEQHLAELQALGLASEAPTQVPTGDGGPGGLPALALAAVVLGVVAAIGGLVWFGRRFAA